MITQNSSVYIACLIINSNINPECALLAWASYPSLFFFFIFSFLIFIILSFFFCFITVFLLSINIFIIKIIKKNSDEQKEEEKEKENYSQQVCCNVSKRLKKYLPTKN